MPVSYYLDTVVSGIWNATPLTSGYIGSGAVLGSLGAGRFNIGSGTIGPNDLASGSVLSGAIASGSIGRYHIGSGQLAGFELGSGAIVSGRVASGAIGFGHLADGSVQSGTIASGAISRFAVASGSLLGFELGSGAIVSGRIASGQISNNHLASGTLFRMWDLMALQGGRLTFTSGQPVPAAVSGSTTIFLTPFKHNLITLIDGNGLVRPYTFSDLTNVGVPLDASGCHDIFALVSGGGVALETLTWTNNTTRATAITMSNGVWFKNADATRRYVGSVATMLVSGQSADYNYFRGLWNVDNRVHHSLRVSDTTSHTYGSGIFRQWNANAAMMVTSVIGVADEAHAMMARGDITAVSGNLGQISAGMDSTTAAAISAMYHNIAGRIAACVSEKALPPAVGVHQHSAIENGNATQAPTFNGVTLSVEMFG